MQNFRLSRCLRDAEIKELERVKSLSQPAYNCNENNV